MFSGYRIEDLMAEGGWKFQKVVEGFAKVKLCEEQKGEFCSVVAR